VLDDVIAVLVLGQLHGGLCVSKDVAEEEHHVGM
jgi:hypothetical protein